MTNATRLVSDRHDTALSFEINVDGIPTDPEQFTAYMATMNDKQLQHLEGKLVAAFDESYGDDEGASLDAEGIKRLTTFGEQIKQVRRELNTRQTAELTRKAEEASAAQREALASLRANVHTAGSKPKGPEDEEDGGDGDEPGKELASVNNLAASLAQAIQASVQRLVPAEALVRGQDLNAHIRNASLSDISQYAPNPKVSAGRSEAVLVASSDIPGVQPNGRITDMNHLAHLMGQRARMLPVTRSNPNYVPVASMQRDFRYKLTLDSTPDDVNDVLTAATDVMNLVAAGGWCAPSEISYDFFNIVCEDGILDLPSVGVLNRGGFRFPTSPTIADIFADSDALWSWTETQDIAAVTGTAQSGVKTCARIDCPDFDEVRAACDGLCVTVGNLTDFAYPELVANHLRLVMAARAHRTNQLVINQLVGASTAVTVTDLNQGSTASILNAIDLQAFDYRERFRMCEDAILEIVLPRWAIGSIRADLANRNGLALFQVTPGMIADWLNSRNVRAQFVADWQSGFSGSPLGDPGVIATTWPATVQFLLYAPGTFVRGQGLQLDLGVVRDSTLNETNDHTAAWMEDCYAVAQVGHESRLVTTATCTLGSTGAADLSCAG